MQICSIFPAICWGVTRVEIPGIFLVISWEILGNCSWKIPRKCLVLVPGKYQARYWNRNIPSRPRNLNPGIYLAARIFLPGKFPGNSWKTRIPGNSWEIPSTRRKPGIPGAGGIGTGNSQVFPRNQEFVLAARMSYKIFVPGIFPGKYLGILFFQPTRLKLHRNWPSYKTDIFVMICQKNMAASGLPYKSMKLSILLKELHNNLLKNKYNYTSTVMINVTTAWSWWTCTTN